MLEFVKIRKVKKCIILLEKICYTIPYNSTLDLYLNEFISLYYQCGDDYRSTAAVVRTQSFSKITTVTN